MSAMSDGRQEIGHQGWFLRRHAFPRGEVADTV